LVLLLLVTAPYAPLRLAALINGLQRQTKWAMRGQTDFQLERSGSPTTQDLGAGTSQSGKRAICGTQKQALAPRIIKLMARRESCAHGQDRVEQSRADGARILPNRRRCQQLGAILRTATTTIITTSTNLGTIYDRDHANDHDVYKAARSSR
jgi:hypothetical protein